MSTRENPFETLGVPRFIVEHEYPLGTPGLRRLKDLCARYARAARQLYHDDVGVYGNREIHDKIDGAAVALEDVTSLEHYARRLLGLTGDTRTLQAQALAAEVAAATARSYAALKALLPCIDTAAVLRREDAEVMLGHRRRYNGKPEDDLDGLYALSVERSGLAMLGKLHVPVVDGLPAVMSRLEPPVWNAAAGGWQGYYMEFVDDLPELCPRVLERTDLFGARLVGSITLDDARRLSPPPQTRATTRELMGGAVSEDTSDLSWFTVDHAWWLEAMTAPVDVGEIAVIINDGTGLIALGGEILAIHDLDQ